MVDAVFLNRLTRFDAFPNVDAESWQRFMAIDQEKALQIEEAFNELIAQDVAIAAVQTALANKNSIFVQASAPTANATNDLWLDSDDGNKPYRWSGSAWEAVQDVGAAYAILGLNSDGTVADDKVVTASIEAGDVLGTNSGYTAGSTNIVSGSYTYQQVASQSFTSAGGLVKISAAGIIDVIDNCKFKYRLKCDGTQVGDEVGPITVNTSDQVPISFIWAHTPSSGAHTYTLEVACNDAGDINVVNPLLDPFENRNL